MPTVHNQSAHISLWPQGVHIQMVNQGTELTHDHICVQAAMCKVCKFVHILFVNSTIAKGTAALCKRANFENNLERIKTSKSLF